MRRRYFLTTANTCRYFALSLFLFVSFAGMARAQFMDAGVVLVNMESAHAAWGDYDNDGDLDVLMTGCTSVQVSGDCNANGFSTRLYRNTGGSFSEVSISMENVSDGQADWGDYDNDGDLDVALTGRGTNFTAVSRIYRNNGNGTFSNISAPLTNLRFGGVAWGDYDNDGDLDVAFTGRDINNTRLVKIYRNNGSGNFSDSGISLTGLDLSSVEWVDYDNDQDLDLFVAGVQSEGGTISSILYRNNGNDTFSNVSIGIINLEWSSNAWGDYDNDGDMDLAIIGGTGTTGGGSRFSRIYRNDGSSFTNISAPLTGVQKGSVAWGDADNDGDLDLLLTGETGGGGVTHVYYNFGGSFSLGAQLVNAELSDAGWADYDGDGDLDILVSGKTGASSRTTRIYRNDGAGGNTQPNSPSGLSANTTESGSATLTWNAAFDSQTPSNGLNYNIRVGSSPGDDDVVAPMSAASGTRRIAARGNADASRSWQLKKLPQGTYYWSVQAIDPTFRGSSFAAEQSFTVQSTPPPPNGFVDINAGLTGMEDSQAAWGDYDNDGNLDVVITGCTSVQGSGDCTSNGFSTRLYRNSGGSFSLVSTNLANVSDGQVAWGDYDGDGDLDIALTGRGTNFTAVSRIYRNNGNGTFSNISAPLIDLRYSAVAWGDYDNDGDLDIAFCGRNSSDVRFTKIYRNNGGDSFSDSGISLPNIDLGTIEWVDVDGDNDLDFFISGNEFTAGNLRTRVYRNDGGAFTTILAEVTGLEWTRSDWGDYDNDGDPDLALIGGLGTGTDFLSRIFRNDGGGNFSIVLAPLPSVQQGDIAWGDYDNDGDLDIFITGGNVSGGTAQVFRNDFGSFTLETSLANVETSAGAWGDYDGDGDLDILLSGKQGGNRITRIYRNNAASSNDRPSPPGNLSSSVTQQGVATLDWSTGSDSETPSAGLTYNLRVGSSAGASDILAPMASASGVRRIPMRGNAGQQTEWRLQNLNPGTYYWSAQTIDHGLSGSTFASERSFIVPFPDSEPPVCNIPDQSLLEDAPALALDLSVHCEDQQDGDNLRYDLMFDPISGLVSASLQGSSLQLTFAGNQSGQAEIGIQATDTDDRSTTDNFTVTIAPVNDAPSFVAGSNQAVSVGAGPQTVSAWATNLSAGPPDEAGQSLSFKVTTDPISLFSAPPELTINGSTAELVYTPAASNTGTAQVTVQLMDDGGTENNGQNVSPEITFTISIGVSNTPPSVMLISPDPDSFRGTAHDSSLTVIAKATDPENNLESVAIHWTRNEQPQASIEMTRGAGDEYAGEIPAQVGGTRMFFHVIATDSPGLKDSTQFRPEYTVRPSVPENLELLPGANRNTLSWDPAVGAETYALYRDTNPNNTVLLASNISVTSYVDTNIFPDTVYYYSVRAFNEGGPGDLSKIIPPCTPDDPAASVLAGPNRIVLHWISNTICTDGFLIWRDDIRIDSLGKNATVYIDTDVSVGVQYLYRITAVNGERNSSPIDLGPISPISYSANGTIQASFDFANFKQPQNYKLVGLPGEGGILLTNTFMGDHGRDWRAFYDNGTRSDIVEEYLVPYSPSQNSLFTFEPGRGFWIIQNRAWSIEQQASTVALGLLNNAFSIDVHSGWNIIANPFFVDVEWSVVQAANGITDVLYSFDQTYSTPTVMRPNIGYYFFNRGTPALTELVIPYPFSESSAKRPARIASFEPEMIEMDLYVRDSERRTASARIGLYPEASDALDRYDQFAPPSAFAAVSVRLFNRDLETDYHWLSQEYRPKIGEGQIFDLEIAAASEDRVSVRFDGLEKFAAYEVYLVNLETAEYHNVHSQPEFRVDLPDRIGKFALMIGSPAFVENARNEMVPDVFRILPNYPNPFATATTFEYTVPEKSVDERVRLEIFNTLGQRVALLVDRPHQPGLYRVNWNGRNGQDASLGSGVYLYRLTAGAFQQVRTLVLVR